MNKQHYLFKKFNYYNFFIDIFFQFYVEKYNIMERMIIQDD